MIKIFRKIRSGLLEKNLPAREGTAKQVGKTGRYLTYALGEIVLVVIGILIALQINNWNENRVNKQLEQEILLSVKREIQENQTLLSKAIKDHTAVLKSLEKLNNMISPEPEEITINLLDSLMYGVGWLPEYVPKDGVLNSIISSGKISLIRNDQISSMLASWNSELSNYKVNTKYNEKQLFEEILPYIRDKYPLKSMVPFFTERIHSKSTFPFSQEELLSDFGFENLVSNRVIDANQTLVYAQILFDFQNEILELIDSELKE